LSSSPVNLTTLKNMRSAYGRNIEIKPLDIEKNEEDPQKKKIVSSFEDSLQKGLQKVNDLQINAENSMEAMVTGDVDDISEVAAAVSEADLSLRFAIQVRDKLLDAYNQLIRISV